MFFLSLFGFFDMCRNPTARFMNTVQKMRTKYGQLAHADSFHHFGLNYDSRLRVGTRCLNAGQG